jgi:hypothetical protein
MEGLVELHDNIMYYLVIILFAVGWILLSIIRNYVSTKFPISHKYLNHASYILLVIVVILYLVGLGSDIYAMDLLDCICPWVEVYDLDGNFLYAYRELLSCCPVHGHLSCIVFPIESRFTTHMILYYMHTVN